MSFIWWHVEDGVAVGYPDTAEVRKRVDAGGPWYGAIEGAILNDGVQATASKRRTDPVYDGRHWFATKEMVQVGYRTTTEVTASPDRSEIGKRHIQEV